MKRFLLTALALIITTVTISAFDGDISQGTLRGVTKDGEIGDVALKHTEVKASISGFVTRVDVRQEFENNRSETIEAVYVFPLSHDGAVDKMTMRIGTRTINGVIMRREEARKTYEDAKQAGQTAALLDQERPNIFTQSLANILPGEKIVIEISYVETLKYENGVYEFVFPMVVAPRYVPENTDGSKISPPKSKARNGHDISIEVNVDAGVPIEQIGSPLHSIDTLSFGQGNASVRLSDDDSIPNRDFILRYDVTGKKIEDAVLVHRDGRGGFFSMILQPPDDMTVEDLTPKEIVFVLDSSGSMRGFPIEKAKETIRLSLKGLHPRDTFNLITFAGRTQILFKEPVSATQANLETALRFLESRRGGGGTEMMKAIQASLDPTDSQEHLRIVCFLTDGQIGNEMAIISEIQKHKNARVFSFGIGNSVNRYLLENMATEGNGEAEIVTLESESEAAAKRFYKRVRSPILTDISIEWNGMPVEDVYPAKLTDLFTSKPVIVNGRFNESRKGSIKLKGKIAGQYYEREINVDFPEKEARHDVLATLWARRRVSELMNSDLAAVQNRNGDIDVEEEITRIGLEFGILTQFTSFVAVEERVVNTDGNPARVNVPTENPDGQKAENTPDSVFSRLEIRNALQRPPLNKASRSGTGGGYGPGSGGGGIGRGNGSSAVKNSRKPKAAGIFSTVTVSGGTSASVNVLDTKIATNISSGRIESLPRGTSFKNLSKLSPTTRPASANGGQVDGTSGAETVFIVDGEEVAKFRSGALYVPVKRLDDEPTSSVATLEKPLIPIKAKWSKKDSIVKVEFDVNEKGAVVKAKAVSGNKSLKKPSEKAALSSKFTPPVVEGDKMPMSGLISYKFVDRENIEITLEAMKVELTPAKRRSLTKKYKLHFWVYALVDRLDLGSTEPSDFEARFVKQKVADLRVVLNDGVKDGKKLLQKAGFDVYKTNGTIFYGKIKIKRIYDLAKLDAVHYVSP
jgi:Ca-activated chloride channel family protein